MASVTIVKYKEGSVVHFDISYSGKRKKMANVIGTLPDIALKPEYRNLKYRGTINTKNLHDFLNEEYEKIP